MRKLIIMTLMLAMVAGVAQAQYFGKYGEARTFVFPMVDSSDFVAATLIYKTGISSWASDSVSIDGAVFAATTNNPAELTGTGVYTIALTAAEMQGKTIILKFNAADALPQMISISTEQYSYVQFDSSTGSIGPTQFNALGDSIKLIRDDTDPLPTDPADASVVAGLIATAQADLDDPGQYKATVSGLQTSVGDTLIDILASILTRQPSVGDTLIDILTSILTRQPAVGDTFVNILTAIDAVDNYVDAEVGAIRDTVNAIMDTLQGGLAHRDAIGDTNVSSGVADVSGLATSAAVSTLQDTADAVALDVVAVKAKTDNLPTDPADQSLLVAEHDATQASVSTLQDTATAVAVDVVAVRDTTNAIIDTLQGGLAHRVAIGDTNVSSGVADVSGLATSAAVSTLQDTVNFISPKVLVCRDSLVALMADLTPSVIAYLDAAITSRSSHSASDVDGVISDEETVDSLQALMADLTPAVIAYLDAAISSRIAKADTSILTRDEVWTDARAGYLDIIPAIEDTTNAIIDTLQAGFASRALIGDTNTVSGIADVSGLATSAMLTTVRDTMNAVIDTLQGGLAHRVVIGDTNEVSGIASGFAVAGDPMTLTTGERAAIEDTMSNHAETYKATGFAVAGDAMALTTAERASVSDSTWLRAARTLTELDEDNTTIDIDGSTVGTVTTATNLTTNNDKTGYSLSTAERASNADSTWLRASRTLTELDEDNMTIDLDATVIGTTSVATSITGTVGLTTAERASVSDSVWLRAARYLTELDEDNTTIDLDGSTVGTVTTVSNAVALTTAERASSADSTWLRASRYLTELDEDNTIIDLNSTVIGTTTVATSITGTVGLTTAERASVSDSIWNRSTRILTALDEDNTTIDLDGSTVGDVTDSVLIHLTHQWSFASLIGDTTYAKGLNLDDVDGTLDNADISDDFLSASKLAANTITSLQVAANTFGASEVADGAFDEGAFTSDCFTNAKFAPNVFGNDLFASACFDSANYSENTFPASKFPAEFSSEIAGIVDDTLTTEHESGAWTAVAESVYIYNANQAAFAALIEDTLADEHGPGSWETGGVADSVYLYGVVSSALAAEIEDTVYSNRTDYKATGFAVAGDAMALTTAERASVSDSIWLRAARTLTETTGFGLSTAERASVSDSMWLRASRTLTELDEDNMTIDLDGTTVGTVTTVTSAGLSTGERASVSDSIWLRASRTLTELDEDNTTIDLDGSTVGTVSTVTSAGLSTAERASVSDSIWLRASRTLTELDEDNTTIDLDGSTVGTVTTATNLTTNNDKTGYGLSTAERASSADSIWLRASRTLTELDEDNTTIDLDGTTVGTVTTVTGAALTTTERASMADSVWLRASRTLTELDEDNTTLDLDGTTVGTATNLTTNNDKTGYGLSTAERASVSDSIWNRAARTLTEIDEDNMTIDLDGSAVGSVTAAVALSTAERASVSDSIWNRSERVLTALDEDGTTIDLDGSTIGTATNLTTNNDKTGYGLSTAERASSADSTWLRASRTLTELDEDNTTLDLDGTTVGTVTTAVNLTTNNDKTGYGLSTAERASMSDSTWLRASRYLTELDEDNTTIDLDGTTVGTVSSITNAVALTTGERASVSDSVWLRAARTLTELDEDNTTLDLDGTTVGTVTTAVNLTTNNDKTGYGLSTAERASSADSVWNRSERVLTALDEDGTTIDLDGSTVGTVTTVTNGVTVTTNNDKTGYGLSTGERASSADSMWLRASRTLTELDEDNMTLDLNGTTVGTVTSITNGVTVSTNSDKTGYGLSTGERASSADSMWLRASRTLTDFDEDDMTIDLDGTTVSATATISASERASLSDSVWLRASRILTALDEDNTTIDIDGSTVGTATVSAAQMASIADSTWLRASRTLTDFDEDDMTIDLDNTSVSATLAADSTSITYSAMLALAGIVADTVTNRSLGSESCRVYIKSSTDSTAIGNVEFQLYAESDTDYSNAKWWNMTDSEGKIDINLDTLTYLVRWEAPGVVVTNDSSITVGDSSSLQTFTFYATSFVAPSPTTDSMCVVTGYTWDANGSCVASCTVRVMLAADYPVTFGNKVLRPDISEVSDATGYFAVELYPNSYLKPAGTQYEIWFVSSSGTEIIPREYIVVPTDSTASFSDLR